MKFKLEEAVNMLERTPGILRHFLENLPLAWTQSNEGGESWSSFDVVGHLIHGEKTDWMVRAEVILGSAKDKNFEPFDRFAQFENSKGKTLGQLLQEFGALRLANIENLRSKNLQERDLEKTGVHPEFGNVSLQQLLAAWVVHDLGHIAQISRVMAKQYKEEVGPWPKYLTILNHTPKEG